MSCEKIKKWLSDSLDGELSEKKRKILKLHLQSCAGCRVYSVNLEKIHDKAKSFKQVGTSPAYWEEFGTRLRAKISSAPRVKRRGLPFFLRWKWVWAGAAVLIAIALLFVFDLGQGKAPQEIYVFSFEDTLSQIYQEIGGDYELEELFNSLILASIGESLERDRASMLDLYEDAFLLENLSEEEIGFLESEIEKETQL